MRMVSGSTCKRWSLFGCAPFDKTHYFIVLITRAILATRCWILSYLIRVCPNPFSAQGSSATSAGSENDTSADSKVNAPPTRPMLQIIIMNCEHSQKRYSSSKIQVLNCYKCSIYLLIYRVTDTCVVAPNSIGHLDLFKVCTNLAGGCRIYKV